MQNFAAYSLFCGSCNVSLNVDDHVDDGGDHGDGDGDGDGPGVLEPNRGGRLHRRHWTDLFQHFGKYQVHDP